MISSIFSVLYIYIYTFGPFIHMNKGNKYMESTHEIFENEIKEKKTFNISSSYCFQVQSTNLRNERLLFQRSKNYIFCIRLNMCAFVCVRVYLSLLSNVLSLMRTKHRYKNTSPPITLKKKN